MYDDQLAQFSRLQKMVSNTFKVKTYLGVALTAVGVGLAAAVIYLIYGVLMQTVAVPFLEQTVTTLQQALEDDVEISSVFDHILRYVTLISLLAIAASLAKACIEAGTRLVQSELKTLLEKLGEELARLWHRTAYNPDVEDPDAQNQRWG